MKKLLIAIMLALMPMTAYAGVPNDNGGMALKRGMHFMSPSQMKAETEQIGLPTEGVVFEVRESDEVNAGFISGQFYSCYAYKCRQEHTTVLFEGDWSKTPYEVRLWTLYHELGHYKQSLDGRPFDEWDADLFAANQFCQRGLDGPYWAYRTFDFLRKSFNRSWGDGDESHGSYAQRVWNAGRAESCKSHFQAP